MSLYVYRIHIFSYSKLCTYIGTLVEEIVLLLVKVVGGLREYEEK